MTIRLTGHRIAVATIALTLTVLLTGCANSGSTTTPSTGSAATKEGGDLVIAGYQEITTLDKDLAGTSNDGLRVLENVYDRLYVLDGQAKPVPSLALSSTLSEDKLTWTFKLRTDAKFSDGTPVTAKDVAFSLEVTSKGAYAGLLAEIKTVTAQGEDTVVITTARPNPLLLELLTIESAGVIKADFGGVSKDDYYKKPIGSGPWMFDSVTQGVGVKLVPNPHWWGPKGHLNSITFNIVADANTRLIQLRSGQAQLIETPDFAQLDSLKAGNTKVLTFPSAAVDFFAINSTKEPFTDVHFRRAINLALNREAIIQAALLGNGEVATSWVAPAALGGYLPASGARYDLAAAKAELAKSKNPIWTAPIELQYSSTGAASWGSAAQVIQANMQELGLTVKIAAVDTNTIQSAREQKSFDLQFRLLSLDIPDPSELIEYYFATDAYNSFLDVSGSKKLYQAAASEFDREKRIEGYKKVVDYINDDEAGTPAMYNVPYIWGAASNLQGLSPILTGQFNFNDLSLS